MEPPRPHVPLETPEAKAKRLAWIEGQNVQLHAEAVSWWEAHRGEAPAHAADLAGLVGDLEALGRSGQTSAIRDLRLDWDTNGGDLGAALDGCRGSIEHLHASYQQRKRDAEEMGVPEHLFREGIDEDGSDLEFLYDIGGLD